MTDLAEGTRTAVVRELRMLNPVERRAARLAWDGASIADIAAATGLTWQHIREAVAFQAQWRHGPPPPGWDPDPQPEPDPDPLSEIGDPSAPLPTCGSGSVDMAAALREGMERSRAAAERLQAEADAERDAELERLVRRRPERPTSDLANGDLSRLVLAAERSGDAHARTLAGRIRRLADDLAAHLSLTEQVALAHQRISTLQTELESLRRTAQRREPAQASREPTGAAAAGAAAVRKAAPATPRLKPTDDLRYSTTVREWAKSQGMEVAETGRLPSRVIDAWRTAHPNT